MFALPALPPARADEGAARDFFERAREFYGNKNYRAAAIELRNALQKDPGYLPAQVLIGEVMLAHGDFDGAAHELRVARQKGADPNTVNVLLARAYLGQANHAEIDREVARGGLARHAEAALLQVQAESLIQRREFRRADEALVRAIDLLPDSATPHVTRATLWYNQGQTSLAKDALAEALRRAPNSKETQIVAGMIALREGRLDDALAAYEAALAIAPDFEQARLGRARALLARGRLDESLEILGKLYSPDAPDPETSFVYAMALAQKGRHEESGAVLKRANEAMKGLDRAALMRAPEFLMFSAMTSMANGQLDTARADAEQLIVAMPGQPEGRFVLGMIQLKLGDAGDAIRTLEPAVNAQPANGALQALYGTALLRAGRHRDAEPALEKALALAPDVQDNVLVLAQVELALDNAERTVTLLEPLYAAPDWRLDTALLLTYAHLQQRDQSAAGAVANAALAKYGRDPRAHTLAGTVAEEGGDTATARKHYARALEVDAGFAAARLRLAAMALREKDLTAARKLYQEILAQDAGSVDAMAGLASIARLDGKPDEAITWLEKLRAADPKAAGPISLLAEIYLAQGDKAKALAVGETLAGQLPDDVEAQMLLARLLIASGKLDRARSTLRRSVRHASYEGRTLRTLAALQQQAEDVEGARRTLQKNLADDPGNVEARSALVGIELRAKNRDAALEQIDELERYLPKSPVPLLLRARLHRQLGEFDEALSTYERAMTLETDGTVARQGYLELLFELKRHDVARRFIESLLAANPDDRTARHALAITHIESGDFAGARREFETLLEADAGNPSVLNNYAWTLYRLGDAGSVEYAQKALALAPEDPEALDTYGWLLVEHGRAEEGLSYLRDSVARRNVDSTTRYHLAAALLKLGRSGESRLVLEELLASGEPFDEIDEARALLSSMGS